MWAGLNKIAFTQKGTFLVKYLDKEKMLGLNGKSPNGVGIAYYYGNTGYWVFKGGIKKIERFLPKNQHTYF